MPPLLLSWQLSLSKSQLRRAGAFVLLSLAGFVGHSTPSRAQTIAEKRNAEVSLWIDLGSWDSPATREAFTLRIAGLRFGPNPNPNQGLSLRLRRSSQDSTLNYAILYRQQELYLLSLRIQSDADLASRELATQVANWLAGIHQQRILPATKQELNEAEVQAIIEGPDEAPAPPAVVPVQPQLAAEPSPTKARKETRYTERPRFQASLRWDLALHCGLTRPFVRAPRILGLSPISLAMAWTPGQSTRLTSSFHWIRHQSQGYTVHRLRPQLGVEWMPGTNRISFPFGIGADLEWWTKPRPLVPQSGPGAKLSAGLNAYLGIAPTLFQQDDRIFMLDLRIRARLGAELPGWKQALVFLSNAGTAIQIGGLEGLVEVGLRFGRRMNRPTLPSSKSPRTQDARSPANKEASWQVPNRNSRSEAL